MIEVSGITKHYPGTTALSNVSLQISPGEVLALAGENGSGKSTLMKILAGHVQPSEGEIRIDGERVQFDLPTDAVARGIGLVEQELAIAPHLSVGENILLGSLPYRKFLPGIVNWKQVRARAREVMDILEVDVDPKALLGGLPVNIQQLVSISSVLSRKPRLLLLDEATSSLSEAETDRVLKAVRRFRDSGMSIVFISHRMAEMRQVADRIFVLRDGEASGSARMEDVTDGEVVKMLVGRELKEIFPTGPRPTPGKPILEADHIAARGVIQDVSLTVREGEIVGLAGLVGSGRSSVAQAVSGAVRLEAGTLKLNGKEVTFRHPVQALEAGIGFVGENRRVQGILPGRPITENLTVSSISKLGKRLRMILKRAERLLAEAAAKGVGAKYARLSDSIEGLSGGNQQKILLARALLRKPSLLVLDEPTRGVDIGAKSEIYSQIAQAAREGTGVLMTSSELPELLGMCDTIYVLSHGRLVGKLDRESATEERIAALAFASDEMEGAV